MKRRGFTLIELMIALAIAMVGIAAAFAFARAQIRGFAKQDEVSRMQSSAQLVLEGLARDVRNAGYGTSFYAGMESGAGFSAATALVDGTGSRGFPAIRAANNMPGGVGVMPGTDAVLLLRITSESVILQDPVGCRPGVSIGYAVEAGTRNNLAPCLNTGLVLLSDSSRPTGEPESMLLPVFANATADLIEFRNAYGINPGLAARCTNDSNPPTGVGVGAFAVCVQPVTYWVDDRARLRMWQPRTSALANAATVVNGVPLDVANDAVLAEGVEDLQIAYFMSAQSGVAGGPVWIRDGSGNDITAQGQMAEARIARITAMVRTGRTSEETNLRREGLLDGGNRLEDHVLPVVATPGCTTPLACYDPQFTRKRLRFQAELRNMRLFDVLSSNTRSWNEMRSFR